MNYTLNQLRIFVAIARHASITKAAEELHLTQPAVSIQLRNFQAQFELALTEVVGRRLYLTAFGREVAALARDILENVDALDTKTNSHKGLLTGRLKISVVSTGKYVMPFFLARFLESNPGVDLFMDVTHKARVIDSLMQNEVDFALVSVVPDTLALSHMTLMENKLYLVARTGESAVEDVVPQLVGADLPFIMREKGSATRVAMERFLFENDIQVKKKIELTSNEAVKQALLAGLGASLMPLIGIKNELQNQELQLIPHTGLPIITNWTLVWPTGKRFSPAANAYLEYLELQKEQVLQDQFKWLDRY